MPTDDFVFRENLGVSFYSCRAFESLPWLRHGFSTRRGGADGKPLNLHPTAGDDPERINDNRRRLLCALGLENAALASLNQIHSDRVYVVGDSKPGTEIYEGDAIVSNVENAAVAVKTADCFPILIVDPNRRVVGAVHSGWRGTLSRILPGTINEMLRRFQSDPACLMAAIGPAIRECCFEVGEDVARLFSRGYPQITTAQPHPTAPGKYLVNLAAVLKEQLTQSGIPQENQYDIGMCTCCGTSDFFSWRDEGAAAGRMMAVIGISELTSSVCGKQ